MTIKHFLILLLLISLSSAAEAQRFNQKKIVDGIRYQQWEAALLVQGQGGKLLIGGTTLSLLAVLSDLVFKLGSVFG